MLLLFHIL